MSTSLYICSISPVSGGFYKGQTTSTNMSINDLDPNFTYQFFNGFYNWGYTVDFYLWSAPYGGTRVQKIGSWNDTVSTVNYVEPNSYSANITTNLTFPSFISTGTWYVGGESGGLRRAVTITEDFVSVSFNLNGGQGTTPENEFGESPLSVTMPSNSGFSRIGYNANGFWNTASNGGGTNYQFNNSYSFSNDTILYAQWEVIDYGVTILENGGTSVSDLTYNISDQEQILTVTIPNPPQSKTFNGWSLSQSPYICATIDDEDDTQLIIPANSIGNIILNAQWVNEEYTITYVTNGGVGSHGNPTAYNIDTPTFFIYQGSMEKEGYTFDGWYQSENFTNEVFGVPKGSTGNKTFYAKWNINQYTIYYESDGGTLKSPDTYDFGESVSTPNNPTKTGYTFNGWSPSLPSTMPANDVFVTAQWVINSYTVFFNENGGVNKTNLIVEYGSQVANPGGTTREGYSFDQWYTEVTLTTPATFPFTMPSVNINLYAGWTINTHTVIFMNGDVEFDSKDLEFGSIITQSQEPTRIEPRFRYIFKGWNTNPNATESMSLGTMPDQNITFYAIYDKYYGGLKINSKNINIKKGSTQIIKVYKGTSVIWEYYPEES